jgi:hypothetical protein
MHVLAMWIALGLMKACRDQSFPLMKQIRIYVAPTVIRPEVNGAHRICGTIINHFIK